MKDQSISIDLDVIRQRVKYVSCPSLPAKDPQATSTTIKTAWKERRRQFEDAVAAFTSVLIFIIARFITLIIFFS